MAIINLALFDLWITFSCKLQLKMFFSGIAQGTTTKLHSLYLEWSSMMLNLNKNPSQTTLICFSLR